MDYSSDYGGDPSDSDDEVSSGDRNIELEQDTRSVGVIDLTQVAENEFVQTHHQLSRSGVVDLTVEDS